MTINVKSSGVWTQANNIFVKDAGAWKQAGEVWVKNAGIWKRAHLRVINLDITSNVESYNVRAATLAAGWDGVNPVTANVRIASGAVVYASNSTTGYALITGTGWPAASDIRIFNSGIISGMGGAGGRGGNANQGTAFIGTAGRNGGAAILAQHSTSIYNYGTIAGGAGGGGGGGANRNTSPPRARAGGGGGGGQTGVIQSSGGNGGTASGSGSDQPGDPGANGTILSGGAGGLAFSGPTAGGPGGAGGNWGSSGTPGTPSESGGQAGGASGEYIIGIANVTMVVSGTLLGTTA